MVFRVLAIFAVLASAFTAQTAPASFNETTSSTGLEKRIDHFGSATWFHVGLGNCGVVSVDSDKIVAIPKDLYDRHNGGNCFQVYDRPFLKFINRASVNFHYFEFQWVKITDQRNGNVHYGQTLDSCPSCGDGLDLSPSLFQEFDNLDVRVIPIRWNFEPFGFVPPN
ncbi:hypothetical protein VKT23_018428 [Stygiomarasmius scandens]|uniref:Uncharacterized protein n=1 Tax=Marasmiellus scandens TaxID=2682957 RepID=A0ABR1IQT2_9AGAR